MAATTVACPNGHQSTTTDFCDTCGEVIGASATPPPPPPSPAAPVAPGSSLDLDATPAAATQECPSCQAENLGDALFCEVCGYDFATGQLPTPVVPGPDTVISAATPAPDPAGADWVAEVWIDPDWFVAQAAAGTCATSGAPAVSPLPSTGALIGRSSRSRNTVAQVDVSADTSVSHRHATLSFDHGRWYIEDLGSTNGTFIGQPGGDLPDTPLVPGARHELADGDRIYLGAWTRIMVRPATEAEAAGKF